MPLSNAASYEGLVELDKTQSRLFSRRMDEALDGGFLFARQARPDDGEGPAENAPYEFMVFEYPTSNNPAQRLELIRPTEANNQYTHLMEICTMGIWADPFFTDRAKQLEGQQNPDSITNVLVRLTLSRDIRNPNNGLHVAQDSAIFYGDSDETSDFSDIDPDMLERVQLHLDLAGSVGSLVLPTLDAIPDSPDLEPSWYIETYDWSGEIIRLEKPQ